MCCFEKPKSIEKKIKKNTIYPNNTQKKIQ